MPADYLMQATEPDCTLISHLPESQQHRLLSSDRRRRTVAGLTDRQTAVSVETLAPQVADGGFTGDIDRVVIDLHHVHLPMLADAGVVDYDPVARMVHPTD